MTTEQDLYIRKLVKAPIYNSSARTWDVEYKEGDVWLTRQFNNHSQAYNFYLDKWEFHAYWFAINQGKQK